MLEPERDDLRTVDEDPVVLEDFEFAIVANKILGIEEGLAWIGR